MTEPLFTVGGFAARRLSSEDAAAARELMASCDGTEDLTCGLPVGAPDDSSASDASSGTELRIGVFEGPDPAGVLEVVRDASAPGWWTIGLLMVETGRRGATLGRDVLEAFAQWAAAQGALGLVVGATPGAGETFWRSAGFRGGPIPGPASIEAPLSPDLTVLHRALAAPPAG